APPDAGEAADAGQALDGGVSPPAPLAAQQPPPPPPVRELRGNERAEKAWEKFAPFQAVRALGRLPEAKLKELGFTESQKLLVLTLAGGEHRFRVSTPGPGFVGQYVMNLGTEEVFLLAS